MNKRIRFLAEQAGIDYEMRPEIALDDELEKFAQLIVRECASRVDWIYAEKGQTIDGVHFTVTQGDLIRQHFGVE